MQLDNSDVSPGELLARAQGGESVDDIMKTGDNTSTDESPPIKSDESQQPTGDDESQQPSSDDSPDESQDDPNIDYEQKIPVHGHDDMTIGELKDLAVKQLEGIGSKEQLSEQEKTKRVETAALQRDLETLAAMWQQQGKLGQQEIQQLQQINTNQKLLKQRQIATLIPEWSEPKAILADLDTMAEFGATYGIPRERFEYMSEWEPQLAFAMRDLATSYKTIKDKLRKRPPPGSARGKGRKVTGSERRQGQINKAKQTGSVDDMKAAMGATYLNSLKGRKQA